MDRIVTKEQKELLFQARLYRFISIGFVAVGLIIFIVTYLKNIEGRLTEALSEPYTIMIFLFPFAPAILLSFLAKSCEKKYFTLKNKQKT